MKPEIVLSERAPEPIGPYSQAVKAGGLVFCSGQIAIDPTTGALLAGDARAQTEQVLANLAAVLSAAGSSLSRVVKTTIYLRNLADFADVNAVYAESFPQDPPARATVGVAQLPRDALVEIDAVALERT